MIQETESPFKQNENAIDAMKATGIVQNPVTIHLFFQNARKESFREGGYERAIVQGLEGYYWLVKLDDAARLTDNGYIRLSPESLLA